MAAYQMITIGAKPLPSLEIPSGCKRNSRISIAQVTPMIVSVEIVGATISSPRCLQVIFFVKLIVRSRDQTLHCAQDRLCRRENTISHDQADAKDGENLQQESGDSTPF